MNLHQYIQQIQVLKPLEQTEQFNNNWIHYDFKNIEISERVKNISNEFPDGISRINIINHFRNNEDELLKGFLMSMIWGHGKSDNRGPWKVSQMLSDYEKGLEILNNAKEAVINNNILVAHQSFENMPRIKVSYFSKYLYFLGRGLNIETYPLIFDTRVAKTIYKLNSIESNLSQVLNVFPKSDFESYNNYANHIHHLSGELAVKAEKIEYFLYLGRI